MDVRQFLGVEEIPSAPTSPTDLAVKDIERTAITEGSTLLDQAMALTIDTPAEAADAAMFLTDVVTRRKRIEDWFKPLIDTAFRAHRALTERRTAALERFAAPERIVRQRLGTYQSEIERQRKEAERAVVEAARAEAERQRIARAEAAMDRGDLDRAEKILEAPPPPVIVPPIVAPAPEKVAGVSFVETWSAVVDDLPTLIAAVADGSAPANAVMADMRMLNGLAKSLKDVMRVPGCRAVCEKTVRTIGSRR